MFARDGAGRQGTIGPDEWAEARPTAEDVTGFHASVRDDVIGHGEEELEVLGVCRDLVGASVVVGVRAADVDVVAGGRWDGPHQASVAREAEEQRVADGKVIDAEDDVRPLRRPQHRSRRP